MIEHNEIELKKNLSDIFKQTTGSYDDLVIRIFSIVSKVITFDISYRKLVKASELNLPEKDRVYLQRILDVNYIAMKQDLIDLIPPIEEAFTATYPEESLEYGGYVGRIIDAISFGRQYELVKTMDNPEIMQLYNDIKNSLMKVDEELWLDMNVGVGLRKKSEEIKDDIVTIGSEDEVRKKYGDVPYGCDIWEFVRTDIFMDGMAIPKSRFKELKENGYNYATACAWAKNCPNPEVKCIMRDYGMQSVEASDFENNEE